jgi:VCBS repeat-containing protein
MTITLNGTLYGDETSGLQANDTSVSAPSPFTTRLTALGVSIGNALDVATSASNFITVTGTGTVASLTFTDSTGGSLNGDASGLYTLDGHQIFLYADSTNPNIVLGLEGSDASTASSSGPIAFALYLAPNGSLTQAQMWSAQFLAIKHDQSPTNYNELLTLGDSLKVSAVTTQTFNFANAPSGSVEFMAFGTTSSAVVVTGLSSSNTVNTSQGGGPTTIGFDSQMVAAGHGGYFTFVSGMDPNYLVPNLTHNEAVTESDISFTGMTPDVHSASFTLVQIAKSAQVRLTAMSTAAEPGSSYFSGLGTTHGDTAVDISGITVKNGSTDVTNQVTIAWSNVDHGVATITGVKDGWTISYTTTDAHNRVLIENPTGSSYDTFDIAGFTLGSATTTPAAVGQVIGWYDDGPSAVPDTGSVTEGHDLVANTALTGLLANDSSGADGYPGTGGVVGVRWQGAVPDLTTAVTTGVGSSIPGQYGTLTLNANGTYTYHATANAITANQDDVFVYTIRDGDGDQATTTLTIHVANVTLSPNYQEKTVDEAALDLSAIGDLVAGTVTGTNPTSTAETQTGQLAVSGTGVTYTAQDVTNAHGRFVLNTDGSYTYTLFSPIDSGAIQGPNTVSTVDTFNYVATDQYGNSVNTGTVKINITDDVPKISVKSDPLPQLTTHDSNLGVLGDDSKSFQASFLKDWGADGPASTGAIAYALGVNTAESTGLVDTASGQAVVMHAVDATHVVGWTATDHQTVFTVSVDGTTGVVTLDQARAVVHANPNDPAESKTLSFADLVTLTATLKDGDGDTAFTTANIGNSLNFVDDGPTMVTGGDFSPFANTLNNSAFHTFTGTFGGDAAATAGGGFKITAASQGSGFTVAYADVNHDNIIGPNEIIGKLNGTDFYSLSVDATGKYTFTLLGTLAPTTTSLDAKHIHAGGPGTNFIDVDAVVNGSHVPNEYLRLAGYLNGQPAAINPSNGNVGVVNGNLDTGEALKIQLINDPTPGTRDSDGGPADDTLIPVSSLTIGTKSAGSATYHYNLYLNGNLVGAGDQTVAKNQAVLLHYQDHSTHQDVLFDTAVLTATDANAVKIGLSGIFISTPPNDVQLNFSVDRVDGDGDHAATNFFVGIDGNGNDLLDAGALYVGALVI